MISASVFVNEAAMAIVNGTARLISGGAPSQVRVSPRENQLIHTEEPHMPLRKITAIAFFSAVAVLSAGVFAQDASPDIAGMTPEQKVERRQEIMKENGGFLRGFATMAPADAVAAADTMIQNFTDLPVLFAEGTIVGDSRATPLIWEEKEAFDAIFAEAKEHAMAIKAAAEAGDAAAIAAEAQELGGYCGQCHDKYRAAQS